MYFITKEQTVKMNHTIAKSYGDTAVLANSDALDLIFDDVNKTDGKSNLYIYNNVYEKAARMCYLLQENKPFKKYNRKTGILYMLTLLDVNNVEMNEYNKDLIQLVENPTYEGILEWVYLHCKLKKVEKYVVYGKYPDIGKKLMLKQ